MVAKFYHPYSQFPRTRIVRVSNRRIVPFLVRRDLFDYFAL